MIFVYQSVVGLLFAAAFLPLLAYVLVSGKHRRGLAERLGLYTRAKRDAGTHSRVWVHAASIGEIKVARMVIGQLARRLPDSEFVVTTMTIHGRDFARSQGAVGPHHGREKRLQEGAQEGRWQFADDPPG